MSAGINKGPAAVGQPRARRTLLHRVGRELKKAPYTAWFGMAVILGYFILALFAPWIAPYGESQVFDMPYSPAFYEPGWDPQFMLGTDQLGRDMLTRLIYGARSGSWRPSCAAGSSNCCRGRWTC
jgi:peptide/nickel transport system permease protein